MRSVFRTALVFLLSVLFASLPAASASNSALGFILLTQGAQVGAAVAANGANVYSGDALTTSPSGFLRLQFASNVIYLRSSSAATLSGDSAAVTLSLSSGTVGFTVVNRSGISISALEVLVRPKTSEPTYAEIKVNGPGELLLTTFRGPLELELDGAVYSLAAGHTFRVDIESQASDNAGSHMPRNRRKLVIAIFGGAVAGGVGTWIYHEVTESPIVP